MALLCQQVEGLDGMRNTSRITRNHMNPRLKAMTDALMRDLERFAKPMELPHAPKPSTDDVIAFLIEREEASAQNALQSLDVEVDALKDRKNLRLSSISHVESAITALRYRLTRIEVLKDAAPLNTKP